MNGKRKLYNAFNLLMQEKDFYDISITDIVKYANINRNTFYYHFKDIYEFVKSFLEDEITNQIKEKLSKNQFMEAYILTINYSKNNLNMLKNLLSHPEPMDIATKIFHLDIRLTVEKVLRNYADLLKISLPEKFYTFFSHSIVEEYMTVPKQMTLDDIDGELLKKVFPLYIDAIPEKLIKVSKLNWNE